MNELLFTIISALSARFGIWVLMIYAWFVATGFFFLFPEKVAVSVRLYRMLFPKKSGFGHIRLAWKQYHNFTSIFLDRFVLENGGAIRYTHDGWKHLKSAMTRKSGAILIQSHVGNWEIAAHLMKQMDEKIRLLLVMGKKHKEQLERMQKASLRKSGVRIVAVDENGGSPFDTIEIINFLKAGGVVSITGDTVWKGGQRAIPVKFLGREALVPEFPHVLALLSQTPMFVFFSFREGINRYHFSLDGPNHVTSASRTEKRAAIAASAQQYACLLEKALRGHPDEWYHFKPFVR